MLIAAFALAAEPRPQSSVAAFYDAPPEWIFAGRFTEGEKRWFREEMERVRAFFYDRYGVGAGDFTIIAAGDLTDEAALTFSQVRGDDPQDYAPRPWAHQVTSDAQVIFLEASGRERFTEYTLVAAWPLPAYSMARVPPLAFATTRTYLWNEESRSQQHIVRAMAHEYFHVLQHRITGALDSGGGPYWLVEGTAELAAFQYGGPDPWEDPYEEVAWQRITWDEERSAPLPGVAVGADLKLVSSQANWHSWCGSEADDNQAAYGYAIAFLASMYLSDQAADAGAYVTYWKLLGDGVPGPQAFAGAFGITADQAYPRFEQWFAETNTVFRPQGTRTIGDTTFTGWGPVD